MAPHALPGQALASHAGRLSPLALDRGRCPHVSEPFILRPSAKCLCPLSTFLRGPSSRRRVVATPEGEGGPAAAAPLSLSFRPGVPAPLELLLQAPTHLRVGRTPRETILSSPGPRSQQHSTQPTRRPSSVLEHSLRPASPTACPASLPATSRPPWSPASFLFHSCRRRGAPGLRPRPVYRTPPADHIGWGVSSHLFYSCCCPSN